jgi:competence protein ComEA
VEPLSRPGVPTSPSERIRAWIEWFGLGRLVGAAAATVIVCGGAFWLVRSPVPATEASLPMASTSTSEPAVTTMTSALADESIQPAVAGPVVVHVAGAVAAPGVYELVSGSRVRDAVAAAGGPTPPADVNALNLAAIVVDASRVYVPVVGEEVPPEATLPLQVGDQPAGPVDVNRATADELDELPGVGPATAAAIVTERTRNGPFTSVDDLDRVPGIGPAKLEALRDLVTT